MTSTPNDIAVQLDHEWRLLRRSPRAIARVRAWSSDAAPAFAELVRSVDDLQDLVDATHAGQRHGDAVLTALIELAVDDQLAGQLLIRRLIPGVLSAVRRYGRLCEHTEPVSEAIGALWIAIRRYDIERRPRDVAAALISDTMYLAFRRRMRLRSTAELPAEPQAFADQAVETPTSAFLELAEVIADARVAGVPTHDLELLRHLVRAESPGLVARQRNVTPRTVRNHRDRAVDRVHRAVAAA